MQFGKLVWKNSRLEKSKSFGKQISTLENHKMVWKTNQYIGKPKNGLENKLVLWKNQNRLEKNSTLEKSKIVRKKYEHGRIKKYFVISVASDCIQIRISVKCRIFALLIPYIKDQLNASRNDSVRGEDESCRMDESGHSKPIRSLKSDWPNEMVNSRLFWRKFHFFVLRSWDFFMVIFQLYDLKLVRSNSIWSNSVMAMVSLTLGRVSY